MMAMVITMNEIATRLYQAITEKGIAIPKSAIQRYATGTTDKIPLERLRALAAALCLPLSALTGWEENERSDEREELPEITMIARAGKKMSPERRQDMLQLLKIAFPEEFRDDDGA